MTSALGTPITSLFASTDGASNPYQIENGSSGRRDEVPRYQRGSPSPNTNVNSRIEASTAAAQRCNPNLDYRLVMNTAPHPKPQIITMMLKRAGCFDYLFFGKCSVERCSFKHDGDLNEAKVDKVIEKMRPGLAKFVEINS